MNFAYVPWKFVSGTFGQLDQKLYNRQLEVWVLGKNPYRTWHRKVPFVGIKACYFMRILLVMVSDYCSKGWIFVPTSGKPGKSRVWVWSKSWTNVKLRDYFTSQILYDPKCWTVARTMNGSIVQYFGSWLNCYMI